MRRGSEEADCLSRRRHVNLAKAPLNELEQLAEACEPASFGVNEKEVLDETYHKAGKMDPERFASLLDPVRTNLMKIIRDSLLEGTQATDYITVELHKLNVYSTHSIFIRQQKLTHKPGKGSFFKAHIDTPRGEKMFGSLVVVFPTPHEGGALFLRHRGHEWMFDSGRELAAERQQSIGYVAFFSDVEHEVASITSGHRVTLTYNLYFGDGGDLSSKEPVLEHLSLPPMGNENAFREAFQGLLKNPDFLSYGGALAFGLRHVYPIENDPGDRSPLEHIYGALKGSDAIVYQTVRALGFQPVLYMHYEWTTPNNFQEAAVIDKVMNFRRLRKWPGVVDITKVVREEGGIVVFQEGWEIDPDDGYENPEKVEWVTPVTTFNRKESTFATSEYESMLEVAYADLCLFVRIGKAGERLVYPTVSQLNKERVRESGSHSSRFWHRDLRWRDY